MAEFINDSVIIDTSDATAAPANGFTGVSDKTIDWATTLVTAQTSKAYDQIQACARQEPTLQFSTEAVGRALSQIGLNGHCLKSAGTGANTSGKLGLAHYTHQLDNCGPAGRNNPATGFRASVKDGHIILNSLSADAAGNATCSFVCHAVSDGTNAPVAITWGTAMPAAATLTSDEMFGLYKCKVLGFETTAISYVTINFGVQIVKPTIANGTIWPTIVRVTKIQPTVTFTLTDPTLIDDMDSNANTGVPCTSTNTVFRFAKREPDGVFASGSTGITVGVTGIAYATNLTGSGGADELEVTITTREDVSTTTAPLVISTAAAMPA